VTHGPRIVFAESDPQMREHLARLLVERWTVEAVADGEAALEAVRRERPALVLSNVGMPRLDGFGVVRALRSDPALRTVPIILFSERAGDESIAQGLESGANDYVIRPFSARELLARISAQIAMAELRQETGDAMARLHRLGTLFFADPSKLEPVLLEIVDTAIAISHAEFGNIQLIDDGSSDLRIVAHRGFEPWWLDFWNKTSAGQGSCGTALERRERVIVPDIEESPIFRDTPALSVQRRAGVRAVVSTPMFSRTGRPIGIFSTHFRRPHRPEERTLQILDLLARQAADIIELATSFDALRKSEERLRTAAVELEQLSRAKDEFLATVSHELRTPLNAILGWAAILRQRPLDPTVAKPVEVIHRNAQAQAKIIEDILDVSRIITGKLRIEPKPADLVAIAREAIEVVRPSADAKGLRLELETGTEACLIVADAERIQQVVWNLLSNAVKFTDAGSITVAVRQDGAQVTLTVTDTGKGILPEFMPFMFDRFRQADASITRRMGGLGLGLALVRHLVELHGGRVAVTSDGPGKGAAFKVTLPVRALVPPDEARTSDALARPDVTAPVALRGLRVLVVDDEGDARDLLREVLVEGGAVVATARSAAEGLELLQLFRPDVLVSDIGMPDEDGYSFLRKVRALPARDGGAVPAIALTAYAREEDRVRAISVGYMTHLAKPVDPQALLYAVGNLATVNRTS
jgi:signal transduction histidine kinase/DNA-binding response OmpR family regulator